MPETRAQRGGRVVSLGGRMLSRFTVASGRSVSGRGRIESRRMESLRYSAIGINRPRIVFRLAESVRTVSGRVTVSIIERDGNANGDVEGACLASGSSGFGRGRGFSGTTTGARESTGGAAVAAAAARAAESAAVA